MDVRRYYMEKFDYELDEFFRKLAICPSVAFGGDSGSGKSTAIIEVVNDYMGKLLRNNIGSIQSSKVRNQIVPMLMGGENNETLMMIRFSDVHLDIFIDNAITIISETIIKAKGVIEDEDIDDAICEILKPKGTKAYDISMIFETNHQDDLIDRFRNILKNCCQKIVKKETDEDYLPDVVSELFKAAKKLEKSTSKRDLLEKETARRIKSANFEDLNEVFKDISKVIKQNIIQSISDLESKGVLVGTNESDYYIVIKYTYLQEIDKFMKDLYTPSGKETVISCVSYFTPMSSDMKSLFKNAGYYKENTPVISINDLKGLELGADSVNETIYSIGDIMPDRIIIFHRMKDTVKGFDSLLTSMKANFPKIPIYGVFSFADLTIGDYIRADFGSVSGPGIPVDKEKEPEYYKNAVQNAYARVEADIKQYTKEMTPIQNNNELGSYCICSNIPEYSSDIDSILLHKRLYSETRFSYLMVNIIKEVKCKYKNYTLTAENNDLFITINDEKLKELICSCIAKHEKRYIAEYYSYRNVNPHWNTIYKWRRMHRIGSGWKSNANVYDNINIFIGPMLSSFISKSEMEDILDFKYLEDMSKVNQIKEYFTYNLEKDIDKYKREIAKQVAYNGYASEFDGRYYAGALDLIKEKLFSEKYWYQSLKEVMERIIEETKDKTFS